MVNHKRRKRLLKLLAEHTTASVQQLVEWLSASPATVRRDISWLAARNLLTRTRGGAENLQQKKKDNIIHLCNNIIHFSFFISRFITIPSTSTSTTTTTKSPPPCLHHHHTIITATTIVTTASPQPPAASSPTTSTRSLFFFFFV